MREYFRVPLKSKVAKNRDRFELDLPVYSMRDKGTRVIVVVNRVPQDDLTRGVLFEESLAGKAMRNIMLYADEKAEGTLGECAFINFHEFRVHDMDESMRRSAEADFTLRIEKFVKRFKPDVIIAMGADVARNMLDKDDLTKYFGRIVKYPKNRKIKFIYTLGVWDFCPDVPPEKRKEEGKKLQSQASLSGILARHFEYAIRKKNLFTLSKADFEIEVVDSMKKFKRMMTALEAAPHVAIDTETKSLARVTNTLLTIQFAIDDTKAWVLPFMHASAVWNEKQLGIIKRRLKKYFERGKSKYHLFQNAKFDLTQLKVQLGLRHYCHDIYDVSGGEYALEENTKFLSDKQMKHLQTAGYKLDHICMRYGWNPYIGIGVDKSSRTGMSEMKLDQFLRYAATDAIVLFRIRDAQLKRAKHEGWNRKVFVRAVTVALSAMNHIFSEMEMTGHLTDTKYLISTLRPGGGLQKAIEELNFKFRDSKAARRVNKKLIRSRGAPKKVLFGGTPWEFDITKPAHQIELFIEEMGLEPLAYGKSGKAQVGKAFIAKYGDPTKPLHTPEVEWFGQLKKSSTIKSNFLVPFWRRLMTEDDMKADKRLRAFYNYLMIITGRSGSSDPNLQNIPARGPLAKLVKRVFIPGYGNIYVKVDFSAHEVRNWANVSGDDVMGGRFKEALKLKRRFILTDRESEKFERVVEALKKRGDIHIQNVKLFYDQWVDKEHPLRQSIKVVIFGVIYGKGPFSLSVDLGKSEEDAQELIDKLFTMFPVGGDWIKSTIAEGQKNFIIETPFGLKRHLWGHLVPDRGVQGAMDRRGPNSLIQGPSSQMGFIAGRNYQNMKWKYFFSKDLPLIGSQNNAVHDSLENESAIGHLPINLYLIEHALTTQVHKVCRDVFGWELAVDLDCEFEIGGSLANTSKWSQRWDELPVIVENSIKYMKDELGYEPQKSWTKKFMHNMDIISELRTSEIRADLKADKYPSYRMDLDHQIVKELRL